MLVFVLLVGDVVLGLACAAQWISPRATVGLLAFNPLLVGANHVATRSRRGRAVPPAS
ncbi:MAG TPA: hypothetical protein VN806_00510 [Caulobacteraceae bacterium]|nr:hypothetical protein [Caulobacteraceae bacterium]